MKVLQDKFKEEYINSIVPMNKFIADHKKDPKMIIKPGNHYAVQYEIQRINME